MRRPCPTCRRCASPRSRWRLFFASTLTPLLALAGALVGCKAPPGVRPQNEADWFRRLDRNALTTSDVSLRSEQFLRSRDLLDSYRRSPGDVLQHLIKDLAGDTTREPSLAMAELSFLEARRQPEQSPTAAEFYLTSLLHAYAYLFDDQLTPPRNEYDPEFRLACDLYNRSLSQLVKCGQSADFDWNGTFDLKWAGGEAQARVGYLGVPFVANERLRFELAYEYEVTGFWDTCRTFGLGAPLIALRPPPPPERRRPEDEFLPRTFELALPMTLLVKVENLDAMRQPGRRLELRVELYDPLDTDALEIGGRRVVLETDFTTPIAYQLEHLPKIDGLTVLLNAPAIEHVRGLHMITPYRKGRIPVVFTHGLISAATIWATMVNELLGDPEIRRNYQFWFFEYPTGNPLLYSGYALRESLQRARHVFDPQGDDPSFNQIVLVGNSMGGLATRLCVIGGGDYLWNSFCDTPLDDVSLPEPQRSLLRNAFYFEPLPFVRRVIFMVTPHRGSNLAESWIANVFAGTIEESVDVARVTGELLPELARRNPNIEISRAPTGIDSLKPSNPVLRAFGTQPIAPHVVYHSIIGNQLAADTPDGTDGIVEYWSSHLDGVASERILKGKHGLLRDPPAAREVRRILLEHLRSLNRLGTD